MVEAAANEKENERRRRLEEQEEKRQKMLMEQQEQRDRERRKELDEYRKHLPERQEQMFLTGERRSWSCCRMRHGEKGTYNFYSLGHEDANGSTKDNGAVFFHTTSNGKLNIVNGLVVIFKDQIDKAGNGMTIGWEWK